MGHRLAVPIGCLDLDVDAAFERGGDFDGGHSGGGCGGDAHVSVFKDEAIFWSDAEKLGAQEVCIGGGFAVDVVFSADDGFEFIHEAESGERIGDRVAAAAGDDGEGDSAVFGLDDFDDLGDWL